MAVPVQEDDDAGPRNSQALYQVGQGRAKGECGGQGWSSQGAVGPGAAVGVRGGPSGRPSEGPCMQTLPPEYLPPEYLYICVGWLLQPPHAVMWYRMAHAAFAGTMQTLSPAPGVVLRCVLCHLRRRDNFCARLVRACICHGCV